MFLHRRARAELREPRVVRGYRRILVPLVDSPECERALDVACSLASEHRASLIAVVVVEVPPMLPLDADMTDDEQRARSLLRRAVAVGNSYGLRTTEHVVRARDAASAIVSEARRHEVEILVLGAPAITGHDRIGATLEHILRNAPCRVMLIADAAALSGRSAAA